MNTAMHIKYFRIYTVDLIEDRAVLMEGDQETAIDHAANWLRGRIRENVCDMHRETILEMVDREKLNAIFCDKDFYESEFLMNRDGQQTWMRAELQLTGRTPEGLPASYLLTLKDIHAMKHERYLREEKKAAQDVLVNQAFENSNILKFTWYVNEGYGEASQGIENLHGAPRRINMPDGFRDNFVQKEYHAIHDEMYARCLQGINRASCELKDINNHWTRVTL